MRKFIRIVNGEPVDHPILEANIKLVFPKMDLDNLPEGWAEFIRVQRPNIGPYEIYQGVNYEIIDGKVYDKHQVRQMIESEKKEKIEFTKKQWETGGGFPSWIFNEQTCNFEPPIPYPEGDEIFVWNEQTISWVRPVQVA